VNYTDKGTLKVYWLTISAHLERTSAGTVGLMTLLFGTVVTAEVGTDVGSLQLLTITTDECPGTVAVCECGNVLGIYEAGT